MVLTPMFHQSIPGLLAPSCRRCSFLGCQAGIVSNPPPILIALWKTLAQQHGSKNMTAVARGLLGWARGRPLPMPSDPSSDKRWWCGSLHAALFHDSGVEPRRPSCRVKLLASVRMSKRACRCSRSDRLVSGQKEARAAHALLSNRGTKRDADHSKQPRGPTSDALETDDDFSPNHLHPYALIPRALFTYP